MIVCSQNDLFVYNDLKGNNATRIGLKNGLPENNVNSIVEGQNRDEFWLSTTNYICLVNIKTKKIRTFTTMDQIMWLGPNSEITTEKTDKKKGKKSFFHGSSMS